MRGYNLSDLAEEGYSFSDAIFVLFQGRIPTQAEEKMLTYEMGSFLEHSMSPSAGSAIAVTAGRPNLPTAVAAGVMTLRWRARPRGGPRLHDEQVSGSGDRRKARASTRSPRPWWTSTWMPGCR